MHTLRGEWNLEQGRWAAAADAFRQAITFAREVGEREPAAEARLALAGFHCGELDDPRLQADLLERAGGARRTLGELWFAIGDRERAERAALAAYKSAWAEGEPYVWRWQLNKARRLLEKLGVEPPNLPPYDAAKDEKLPWEDEVRATIETLRAETQRRVSRP